MERAGDAAVVGLASEPEVVEELEQVVGTLQVEGGPFVDLIRRGAVDRQVSAAVTGSPSSQSNSVPP
jgi:hypothetical protein